MPRRLPRPRFTLRTLMAAVLVAALVCAAEATRRRWAAFRIEAQGHDFAARLDRMEEERARFSIETARAYAKAEGRPFDPSSGTTPIFESQARRHAERAADHERRRDTLRARW